MKKGCIVCLVVLLLYLLAGCNPTYPVHLDRQWYCEELNMTLDYRESTMANKHLYVRNMFDVTWSGETIKVIVGFGPYEIFLTTVTSRNPPLTTDIYGTWKYEGNNIIVEVEHDKVFQGELTGKTLIFVLVE